jgi:YEATS domain-containing protein 4
LERRRETNKQEDRVERHSHRSVSRVRLSRQDTVGIIVDCNDINMSTTASTTSSSVPATSSASPKTVAAAAAAAAAAATTTTSPEKTTRRTKNTTAYLPIVYGSIAHYLGKKKTDEYNTHEWTLFVRGPNQEDFSPAISKVVFQLHPSFAQPTRELTEPPYEVTERGWGEFEAQIRIHWKEEAHERSTVVNHTIKLYPPGTPPNFTPSSKSAAAQNLDKPVLDEVYDEVVFTNPTEDFYQSLQQIEHLPKIELESAAADGGGDNEGVRGGGTSSSRSQLKKEHVNYYNDEEDFLALIAAQKFLQDELSKVKRRFEIVTEETSAIDRSIASAATAAAVRAREAQQQAAAASAAMASSSGSTKVGPGGVGGGSTKKRAPSKNSKKPPSKKTKTSSSNTAGAGAGGSTAAATTMKSAK